MTNERHRRLARIPQELDERLKSAAIHRGIFINEAICEAIDFWVETVEIEALAEADLVRRET